MIRDATTARLVHYAFEWAALVAGLLLFRTIRRKHGPDGLLALHHYAVVIGALLGAAAGNKLAGWIDLPTQTLAQALAGQSVIGALLGGWIGVELGKRCVGLGARTGDDFVQPILLGLGIGRIGCLLAGLHDGTYGNPTSLPWGMDLGDGIPRHPTALYECLLAFLALWSWPSWSRHFSGTPGRAFRVFMLGYVLWRLGIDGLKPVPFPYPLGMSGLQWICAVGAAVISIDLVRHQGEHHHVQS